MLMVDSLTKDRRSLNMGRIRGKNTKPELVVRSLLHRWGFRFTVNAPNNKNLPGRPDIVMPRFKTVILVHGCYWHRHTNCKEATTPGTRTEFWTKKFEETIERDLRNVVDLERLGWSVAIVWECEIKRNPVRAVKDALKKVRISCDTETDPLERNEILKVAEKRFKKSFDEDTGRKRS